MSTHATSIELIVLHYAGGDSEAHAPDLVYLVNARSEPGSVTMCLENTEDDPGICSLTLPAQRSVAPATNITGERIICIATPTSQIEMHVTSADAQHYWTTALTNAGTGLSRLPI